MGREYMQREANRTGKTFVTRSDGKECTITPTTDFDKVPESSVYAMLPLLAKIHRVKAAVPGSPEHEEAMQALEPELRRTALVTLTTVVAAGTLGWWAYRRRQKAKLAAGGFGLHAQSARVMAGESCVYWFLWRDTLSGLLARILARAAVETRLEVCALDDVRWLGCWSTSLHRLKAPHQPHFIYGRTPSQSSTSHSIGQRSRDFVTSSTHAPHRAAAPYKMPAGRNTRAAAPTQKKLQGIRIASSGARAVGVDEYEYYKVSLTHDIFDYGELCRVSQLVGMPLLVLKLQPDSQDSDSAHHKIARRHYRNKPVERLMICCDSDVATLPGEGLCQTSPDWKNAGSVLVVREDKEDLYEAHLHLLLGFILDTKWHLEGGGPRIPEERMAVFRRCEFREYYMSMRAISGDEDEAEYAEGLAALPSPFVKLDPTTLPTCVGRRNKVRAEWKELTLTEKYYRAETWREEQLVMEMWVLRGNREMDFGRLPVTY
ncbi:hypothetical protein LTR27_002246 [Elasticomyces elasticus]|nr:hypothetical protein LTR27_002246 [Elasticomyces elasticus]